MLDFAFLEQKFGTPGALHCLQEIEKAARISRFCCKFAASIVSG